MERYVYHLHMYIYLCVDKKKENKHPRKYNSIEFFLLSCSNSSRCKIMQQFFSKIKKADRVNKRGERRNAKKLGGTQKLNAWKNFFFSLTF